MSEEGTDSELLLISEAVARLKVGMYGNLGRPEAVTDAKRSYPGASVGFGPQKEHAATFIDRAVTKGELSVFVRPDSGDNNALETPLQVPPDVLGKMIRTRGGLPDHVFQAIRILAKDSIPPELLAALSTSALYLHLKEFEAWYKEAKKNPNWPSQRSSSKLRLGRPSKQRDLRTPIVVLANEGRWSARQKIADLVRLLELKGIAATRDTTRRTVDQLFKETGEQRFRLRARKRSAVKRTAPSQSI